MTGSRIGYLKLFLLAALIINQPCFAQKNPRITIDLDKHWRSCTDDTMNNAFNDFYTTGFDDKNWKQVNVPHNWDQYEGYRRLRHGNKHGYAWYRKTFHLQQPKNNKRYFLYFEGVGSYATIWLNGKKIGGHAGGRTSFTIDASTAINLTGKNILAVRADHPAMINDLPWICGGCSDDRGWSEGSQPLGIFRPVHLVITHDVRIEPFGVHIYNKDKNLTPHPVLNLVTTLKNYEGVTRKITLINKLLDEKGQQVTITSNTLAVNAGTRVDYLQQFPAIHNPHLWSVEDPYLYRVVTEIHSNGKLVDKIETPYGIRWISWPTSTSAAKQFLLNNKPVFINGTCEYEHLMGKSHAFDSAQIKARVMQVKAAGFNAFRDAHQPHNLLYNQYWNKLGILNWAQFSAHAWYDSPEFRKNFKLLLSDWVKERRNDPAVIMWGLQNESKIPADFARECTELIRKLDPTAATERLVTTCNGGEGTDWNVPQNWSGTYGGNPLAYGEELKRQLLVGEYGAWRTLDLHTEGEFDQNGSYSEDRMTQLMETKLRLAESVKDSVAGHFHWLFSSHENPGRVQSGEGYRELDRIGPLNYKGLFTPWGEPTDAFYMYRANYVSNVKEPMVYIVSHTWPDRWLAPGIKNGIVVYSNCDEVELFNDMEKKSLGKRTRNGIGTHFQWDAVDISYNLLYAEGKVNGKLVARDTILLNHLPEAPGYQSLKKENGSLLKPEPNYHYLYRVNCGGDNYTDRHGNVWLRDAKKVDTNTWGSRSWTDAFNMPAFYASQRYSNDPVTGTVDWPLFQDFRYGMDKLNYKFPVSNGTYLVELYFIEPWYGTGGGMDCTGWRKFDVAVNGKTFIKDLDIWKEAGHDKALKKTIKVHVTEGSLLISFPNQPAGQPIISAIAIASMDKGLHPAPAPKPLITDFAGQNSGGYTIKSWLNTGNLVFKDAMIAFSELPASLYGAWWLQGTANPEKALPGTSFRVNEDADVFIATPVFDSTKKWLSGFTGARMALQTDQKGGTSYPLYKKRVLKGTTVAMEAIKPGAMETPYLVFVTPVSAIEPAYDQKPITRFEAETAILKGAAIAPEPFAGKPYVAVTAENGDAIEWAFSPGVADRYSLHFRYVNKTGKPVHMQMKVVAADGSVMNKVVLEFPPTTGKWATVDSDTGTYINAGNYKVILSAMGDAGLGIDYFEVQ